LPAVSFLTDLPQDWTRPELPTLRDLFVMAYRRPTSAEHLADVAGIVPGTFPYRDTMRQTWTALVKVMGNQGKLPSLVERAAADPEAAAYRPRFQEMLGDHPAVPPPQPVPAGDWWKGDDRLPGAAERLQFERLMEHRSRLVDIELAQEVVRAAGSVAKLTLRFDSEPGYGTGFLIGPEQILTNHHNTMHAQFGPVRSAVAEFDHDRGRHDTALVRKARTDSVVSDAVDDWAILELSEPVDRPALTLGTPFDVGVNDLVVIIQHPQGGYKQFSLEPLAVRYVDDTRIQYVADTQHGSSGSPVFNSRMQVIALHHAEVETQAELDGLPQTVWRNQGIHIAQVMRGLRDHGIAFTTNE
jgi:S1-C subfamily serine protease